VVENRAFPDHRRVGQWLVRPAVVSAIETELSAGMSFADAEAVIAEWGLTDASAMLSTVGYRVEWEGLTGGVLKKR